MREIFNKRVLQAVWPVCFGYIPLGMACGILAQKVGFDWLQMLLLSLLLFAGSGQFITLAMIGSGSNIFSVVLTVFIVNLRHLLYSLILAGYIRNTSWLYKMVFAQEIVDETFAVNHTMYLQQGEGWQAKNALGVSLISHGAWIISTVVGVVLGNTISVDTALVSYALIAMFIGLWSFHFVNKRLVLTGVASGILSLLLSFWLDNMLNVIVATIFSAIVATIVEKRKGEE